MTRILIIEGHAALREDFATILSLEGYEVFTAADGLTGLKLVMNLQPALVLTEIELPILSGYDILKALRAGNTFCPHFIFMGAAPNPSYIWNKFQLGEESVLAKAFDVETLLERVKLILLRGVGTNAAYQAKKDLINLLIVEHRKQIANAIQFSLSYSSESIVISQADNICAAIYQNYLQKPFAVLLDAEFPVPNLQNFLTKLQDYNPAVQLILFNGKVNEIFQAKVYVEHHHSVHYLDEFTVQNLLTMLKHLRGMS
jgi:CheY-like chemotaxis protein